MLLSCLPFQVMKGGNESRPVLEREKWKIETATDLKKVCNRKLFQDRSQQESEGKERKGVACE